jgi:hypothetical protein
MKKPLKQIQSTLQSFFTDDQNKTVTLGFLNEKEVQQTRKCLKEMEIKRTV